LMLSTWIRKWLMPLGVASPRCAGARASNSRRSCSRAALLAVDAL
jgi:hypothetical protein